MTDLESLRILLVQIRTDAHVLAVERRAFVDFSGLKEDQITTLDVFKYPDFPASLVEDYDALMMGGLSDDASDRIALPHSFHPIIDNLNGLMQQSIERQIPSLLSCGGFMLASLMLGARVIIDPDQAELGMYQINLTEQAKTDVLLGSLPPMFKAVSGHNKSTVELPPNCIHLAYSERCQVHGFKVAGAPFYAFQFHPEITCSDLEARLEAYKDKYFATEEGYQAFINMCDSTEVANSIITRFVALVGHRKQRSLSQKTN
ncbi:MAG: hypothetical protein OEQ53_11145 [Saprospiraceae bacterium]|nr:hypothetical protein [Saprospiraceae bacterium]